MRNLLKEAAQIGHGVAHITDWLGSGGLVVDAKTSQARADVCLSCPLNVDGGKLTEMVALAIRSQLEVKNRMLLKVQGEKSLKTCSACGCQLRLLVHEPQARVRLGLTEDEIGILPANCWKLQDEKAE